MIISYLRGGLGNQLFQYAAGRRLAHKLNTELKLDVSYFDVIKLRPYVLNFFNITAAIATPEEIARVKNSGGIREEESRFMPEVLDYPDNVWLYGYWTNEKYFADIRDILLKEFTLRNPLSAAARRWREKILAAECSVSLHVRHGDYAYNPNHLSNMKSYANLPIEYHYKCLDLLKQQFDNLTAFVFSDNPQWCKKNIRSDVPVEYVSGGGVNDIEEFYLMSLCKHNIRTTSTFSWWAAYLNQNPDKKVFTPIKPHEADNSSAEENSSADSDKWIRVPFELKNRPDITQKPYFSLLLVVNDDAATLSESLSSIVGQDYKFFEVVVIDNASTDGSDKICRQIAKATDKVTFISLHDKISDGAAWNKALDLAQGEFVIFLKGNDRLLGNALSSMYMVNEYALVDIVNSVAWLAEDDGGDVNIANKKFSVQTDAAFRGLQRILRGKFDNLTRLKILTSNEATTPLGTRIFKRKFLAEKQIRFNETGKDI